jgi:hypothetical protein
MMRRLVWMTGALMLMGLPAGAQQWNAGIRAGVSADPDQFFFGGHVESQPLMERLTFRPNAEIGVGDDVTTIALNVEFAYWLTNGQPWDVYVGAGPAVNIFSFDDDRPGRGDDDGDVGGGFNILVGVQHRQGLFTELKVGMIDSPNLKFAVGYVFRPR